MHRSRHRERDTSELTAASRQNHPLKITTKWPRARIMSSGKRRRTNMEVPASGDGMDDDSARSGSHANGNGDTTMDIDLPRLQDELAELKLRHADLKEEKERLEESVVRLTESLKDSGLATLRAKYALNLIPVVLVSFQFISSFKVLESTIGRAWT